MHPIGATQKWWQNIIVLYVKYSLVIIVYTPVISGETTKKKTIKKNWLGLFNDIHKYCIYFINGLLITINPESRLILCYFKISLIILIDLLNFTNSKY